MSSLFVRIQTTDLGMLQELQRNTDLDIFHRTARQRSAATFEVEGLLSEAQIERLRAAGYHIEVIADANEIAQRRRADIGRSGPPGAAPTG